MMPGPGAAGEWLVPAIAPSMRAASATVVASEPLSDRPNQPVSPRSPGTMPVPGLMPNSPQAAAGMRTDPRPSVPCASGTSADATAAAAPPDEPPGVRRGFHGLRATP